VNEQVRARQAFIAADDDADDDGLELVAKKPIAVCA
jgi:hypothetical protein